MPLLWISQAVGLYSQSELPCGYQAPSYQEFVQYLQLIQPSSSPQPSSQAISLPVHIVLVTDANGNSNWGNAGKVGAKQLIDNINAMFTGGISFYACSVKVLPDSTNELLVVEVNNSNEYGTLWNLHHVDTAINIYLLNGLTRNGVAIAGNSPAITLPYTNSIAISAASLSARTAPHELGHYFGLVHTDQGTQIVNTPACYVHSSYSIEYYCSPPLPCGSIPGCVADTCFVEGDGICDTPADPGPDKCVGDCNTPCMEIDSFGNTYAPDKQNLMSLYPCSPQYFSPEQHSRMWDCLNNHPNRTFLLNLPPSNCQPIAAEKGKVERACQTSSGLQLDPFQLVRVDITRSNHPSTFTKVTNQLVSSGGSPNPLAGKYNFNESLAWAYGGDSVIITCKPRNNFPSLPAFDPLNGVNSIDLLYLQQHINGIAPLANKPYGWIAGDVNNDGVLSHFDRVLISKVMLGVNSFDYIGTWRYVPTYYLSDAQFASDFVSNPFTAVWHDGNGDDRAYLQTVPPPPPPSGPFTIGLPPPPPPGIPTTPKSYMNFVEVNMRNYAVEEESTWSFRAVKSGDVDCDADVITSVVSPDEDPEVEVVSYPHDCFQANEEAVVCFKASGALDISAFQLGLSYDETAVEVLGISQGELPSFALSNFNIGEGKLRTLWIDETGVTPFDMDSPKTLFKAHVKFLRQNCDISQIIDVNDSLLKNRFYDEDGISRMMDLAMQVEESNELPHTLNNVYPNPFGNSISFNFSLVTPEQVSVVLSDGYGNVQTSSGIYGQGSHTHTFQPSNVFQNGLIYYKVMLGSKVFTGSIAKLQ